MFHGEDSSNKLGITVFDTVLGECETVVPLCEARPKCLEFDEACGSIWKKLLFVGCFVNKLDSTFAY